MLTVSRSAAMPTIRSYTPPWLTEPAPGHNLFAPSEGELKASTLSPYASRKRAGDPGPRRTIARRGTEVFVANGRELKWGDLIYLKDAWDSKQNQRGRGTPITRESSSGFSHSFNDRTNGDVHFGNGYRVCPKQTPQHPGGKPATDTTQLDHQDACSR